MDAAGIKPRRKPSYYIKVYSFKTAKKLLPLFFGRKRGQEMIDRWRGSAGSADYRNSSPMMRAVMSRCVNQDLKHVMPQIKASTLLIWGAKDTATPLSDAKYMEKHIPVADRCGSSSRRTCRDDRRFKFKYSLSSNILQEWLILL